MICCAAGSPTALSGFAGSLAAALSVPAAASVPLDQSSLLRALVAVLRTFAAVHGPTVILLEDLHTFDSWSWELLLQVRREGLRGTGLFWIKGTGQGYLRWRVRREGLRMAA